MASFRLRNNKWQVRVRRHGHNPVTKSFTTKQDAVQWARSIESQMDRGSYIETTLAQKNTLADLIELYIDQVLPTLRGYREDRYRLNAIKVRPICRLALTALTPKLLGEYRDQRLKEVSAGTVIRELSYISSVINHARREWGINIDNPVKLVRKPPTPQGRNRILGEAEKCRILQQLQPTRQNRRNPWMPPLIELALETAMRRGELLSLRWENVDLTRRVAYLPITKNGESRSVPLSTAAVKILQSLPRNIDGRVFPIEAQTVAAAFMKAVKRAGVEDFHFHDLRHTAITNLAGKLSNVIELSAVSGHKTLSMLKRYTHLKAEDLAMKLG